MPVYRVDKENFIEQFLIKHLTEQYVIYLTENKTFNVIYLNLLLNSHKSLIEHLFSFNSLSNDLSNSDESDGFSLKSILNMIPSFISNDYLITD